MDPGYKPPQEQDVPSDSLRNSLNPSENYVNNRYSGATILEKETVPALYPPIRRKPVGSATKPVIDPAPDGGILAWLQVLGSFFLFFASWYVYSSLLVPITIPLSFYANYLSIRGLINSYGVFQAYYETTLIPKSSSSNISWIGSIQAALLLSVGLVAGPIFDRGYLRTLIIIGTVCTTVGMMTTSVATEYYQLVLAQGFLVGIGSGCLFTPSMAILATYFDKKKAIAFGAALTGGSVGGVVLPIAFQRLLPKIGFGWATRVISFIILGGALVSLAVMRIRVLPTKPRAFLDLPAFRDPVYAIFSFSLLPVFAGLYIPAFYIEIYAYIHAKTSFHLSSYLLALLNGCSVFGRLIPNYFADKTGPLNMIIPCTFIAGLIALCWLAIDNSSGAVAFCIFYGFFSGSVVSLSGPVIQSVTKDLSTIGTRTGMTCTIGAIGVLIGNPIAGTMINYRIDKFRGAQIFCGVMVLCAGILMFAARVLRYNENHKLVG